MFLDNYLCCPTCKRGLVRKGDALSCRLCRIDYEIRNGIPILVNLQSLPDHLRGQIEYFEREDEQRNEYRLEPWQKRYIDNFLRYGHPSDGGLIIDDATGSGYMAVELAKLGYQVIATDLTFKELIKLKKTIEKFRLSAKVMMICANSEQLPIKSNVADGLVANAILEHLPNEKEATSEITRVVKKGAPVMVAMPLAYRYVLPFFWLINWWYDRRIGHLRRYTRKRILGIFGQFREIRTYYTGHLMKVACLALAILTGNAWWNIVGEEMDRRWENIFYGANNVVSIVRKK